MSSTTRASSSGADRSPAEHLFEEFVDRSARESDLSASRFLGEVPSEHRAEVGAMLQDYARLRSSAGTELRPPTAGRVLGDFRLVALLGSGAAGDVWEAEQLGLRRRVALKILPLHHSVTPARRDRFRLEAEAGARLQHPGIVGVHGFGEHEGVCYIAQELVPGGRTLADRLREARELHELPADWFRSTAELFAKVADAMQAAHDAGVVHRDLKPANILLTEDGEPKVADFGLARIEDELGLSRTGELAGTPYYMSPEQAAGKRMGLDHRTDVFSLGATLYEALTLRRPFDGDTQAQVLEKILLADPVPPGDVRSRIPEAASTVCLAALRKRREARYARMGDLAADLRRALAGEPVRARRVGALERAGKWIRRNRWPSLTGAIALLALVVVSVLLVRDRALRSEAERSSDDLREAIGVLGDAFRSSVRLQERGEAFTQESFLDHASRTVAESLGSRPDARAELQRVLAGCYVSLARFGRASEVLRDALDGLRSTTAEDDPIVLALRLDLAVALRKEGRNEESLELALETRALEEQRHGDDPVERWRSAVVLGDTLFVLEQADRAHERFASALAACRAHLPPHDREALAVAVRHARTTSSLGRDAEAVRLCEEVLAVQQARFGAEDVETLETQAFLGFLYAKTGDAVRSEAARRAVYEVRSRRLAPDHRQVLDARIRWASSLGTLGELGAAERELRAAIELGSRLAGAEHEYVIPRAHSFLGRVLLEQGRREEGLDELRSSVRRWPDGAHFHAELAWRLVEGDAPTASELEEARAASDHAVELSSDQHRSSFLVVRARVYLVDGRPSEAASAFERALAEHHPSLMPIDRRRAADVGRELVDRGLRSSLPAWLPVDEP